MVTLWVRRKSSDKSYGIKFLSPVEGPVLTEVPVSSGSVILFCFCFFKHLLVLIFGFILFLLSLPPPPNSLWYEVLLTFLFHCYVKTDILFRLEPLLEFISKNQSTCILLIVNFLDIAGLTNH